MSELFDLMVGLVVFALLVEAITELIVDSKLFSPARSLITWLAVPGADQDPNAFPRWRQTVFWLPYNLVSCGYCLSVWVSAGLIWLAEVELTAVWASSSLLVKIFCGHRLANLLHAAWVWALRGRVGTYDVALNVTQKTEQDGSGDG